MFCHATPATGVLPRIPITIIFLLRLTSSSRHIVKRAKRDTFLPEQRAKTRMGEHFEFFDALVEVHRFHVDCLCGVTPQFREPWPQFVNNPAQSAGRDVVW